MKHHVAVMMVGAATLALSAAPRAQAATVASPLRSFDWTYPWKDPGPNNGHWTSPDGVTWTQTFPGGRKPLVRVVMASERLAECHGVIAKSADPATVEVLIPDPGCQRMDLQYRSQNGPWRELGPMRAMTTAYGPWSSEPAVLQPRVNGCSGWAEGPWGERVQASIARGVVEKPWADWIPPHLGTGPMSLRLTYGVRAGRLGDLKRVLVEGEPGALYDGDRGYVTVKTATADYVTVKYDYYAKPAAKSTWRLPLRADHSGAFHAQDGATTLLATAVLASDHPRDLFEAIRFRRRLQAIRMTEGLDILTASEANGPFSHGGYDISNRPGVHNDNYRGDRDDLFAIAYARATHGLQAGCGSLDAKCECNG